MRKIIPILFILIVSLDSYSIKVIEDIIEPAMIEVRYERRMVRDTLDCANDFRTQFFTLKAGKSVSAFYSAELKTIDSTEYRNPDAVSARLKNNELWNAVARLPIEKVFKYFDEKKVISHDRFDLCHWLIEEELCKPVWTITDFTRNILGYECILAFTEYRGRKWEAWFTPEIPISDGPWKLCGLPGLILKAQDSKGHYVYEPLSVRTDGIGNVEYYDYESGLRFISTREKALQRKYKALHTDMRYVIKSSHSFGLYDPSVKKRDVIPHRNYDFEETDYLHKK